MGDFKVTVNTSYFSDKTDVAGAGGYQARPTVLGIINTRVSLTSYKTGEQIRLLRRRYFNEFYQNPYILIDIARDRGRSNRFVCKS
jgi:hypothetical protein